MAVLSNKKTENLRALKTIDNQEEQIQQINFDI